MSSTAPKCDYKTNRLLFYFWLPAGEDEFEFAGRHYSPFPKTADYRDESAIERTIAKGLQDKLRENSSTGLRLISEDENLDPQDADLGLRMVEFKFRYERAHKIFDFPGELAGSCFIFSNGLYLWQFDFAYPSRLEDHEIVESARDFLREDFVKNSIKMLFDFDWNERAPDSLSSYNGALTYYQIDILFNGIFDKDAHPDNFIKARAGDDVALYDVGRIIQSASFFAIKDRHFTLLDNLTDFASEISLKERCESPISTDIALSKTVQGTKERERLLSRISYTGMKQFIKVAVSFSLVHYKAGLDHCRAQLTEDALQIRISKTSGELRRPSLSPEPFSSELSAADLQSYTSIVAGKLPAFQFLHSLIESLAQASRPSGAQNNNRLDESNWAEWSEWAYSRSTLHEALLYYNLNVTSIKEDIREINRSLEIGRTDQIIAELTDARKIAEIELESPRKIILTRSDNQLDELMVTFTFAALMFSAVQAYASLGVWFMDKLLDGTKGVIPVDVRLWEILIGFGQWVVLLPVLILIYKRQKSRSARGTANIKSKQAAGSAMSGTSDELRKDEVYVFDYSFLHEKLSVRSGRMIKDLASSMPSIAPKGKPSPCASQSIFRETPLSATERTKYTLESHNSSEGSYTLYVEVDRRMRDEIEHLREVRLVIKRHVGQQYDVKEHAKHIILDCVSFGFRDADLERVKGILGKQFEKIM